MDNTEIIKNLIDNITNDIIDNIENYEDDNLFNSDNDYKITEEEIFNVSNNFDEIQYTKMSEILHKLGFKVDKNKLKNIK
jgi:aspartyl/asparaginyl-tRNA synthetase